MISKKYDEILKRNLTNAERLHDTLATISFMRRAIDTLEYKVKNVSDDLTLAQLMCIEDAVEVAYDAIQNAEFLGTCGYRAKEIYPVHWCWSAK